MMRCTLKSFCTATVVLLAVSSPALAQGIAAGSGEVTGNIGFSNLKGVDNSRHISMGGSGTYNLTQLVGVGFEYNFQSMGSQTISGIKGSEHLQMYGPVARFALMKSARVVPFALVAAGGVSDRVAVSAGNVSMSASQGGFYAGFGGGASIYAGNNWGIRPEFRYERQHFNSTSIQGISVGSYGQNYAQGSVAVFYQFGGRRS
jgi:Outer membrane protein beta-barrel domain